PAAGASAPAAGPTAPEPGVVPCRVSVGADREYHQRVQAMGGPDVDAMMFPRFCPERHFELTGQALVGRHSRSRGIDPQIDLTGPPEDPGVSHTHALLVPSPDGTWSVVDLDSSNGTYVNESSEPLPANTATPLRDGDRVHVGAWTTLTFHTAAAPAR
ncbi:MAG: FHA domain-containing protein, partial [Actinocatenispora sp.]